MAEKHIGNVQVPITQADKDLIQQALDGSPFSQEVLLKLAVRIGLTEIRKDPTVLMQYLAKKEQ